MLKFIHKYLKIQLGQYEAKTEKGVVQGMISSPALFNIFIVDAIEDLTNQNFHIIAYADDICGVAET